MNKKSTIRRVLKYIKKYLLFVILSLLLAAAGVALTLYAPILSGKGIDLIVSKGNVDFD